MQRVSAIERRMCGELRFSEDDGKPTLDGYPARFNVRSEDLGFGFEVVAPGAFTKTLQESDVVSLWNHDSNLVLGRVSAETLELEEDEKGLRSRIFPPDTQWGRDAVESIRRRDVSGMSFGFRTIRDKWVDEDGVSQRTLLEVQLIDVSPVTFPAYPQTDVAVRSLLRSIGATEEDFRDFSQLFAAARGGSLTPVEFRSMLEPITRELRERKSAPGPAAHPEDRSQTALEAYRRRLDLLDVEL